MYADMFLLTVMFKEESEIKSDSGDVLDFDLNQLMLGVKALQCTCIHVVPHL